MPAPQEKSGGPRIVVSGNGTELTESVAAALAARLGLPLLARGIEGSVAADLVLCIGARGLELVDPASRPSAGVHVDLVRGATGHRRRSGLSRSQPIGRAVGFRHGPPTLVDATAGLGRDAFLLACLGCTVVAVERSPVLAALLEDGLGRARASGDAALTAVVDRISLRVGDARSLLACLPPADRPDVVYLDPMYPHEERSALAKKEMRVCRMLVGDDADAGELLRLARSVARRRVVLKRHRLAPALADDVSIRYTGRSVRYDVYLTGTERPGEE
ncbi:MAG: class I SAM-dependent methyltransferase [Planctomycetes bacterium]|nr:class I SAM-dependent methyltransferase [Planctomycetota bacterium]